MSGNKPPWTLPAKAAYGVFDTERAKRYFGTQDIRTPEFFPILSILVSNETHGLLESLLLSMEGSQGIPSHFLSTGA
jgi:hypothetical protein